MNTTDFNLPGSGSYNGSGSGDDRTLDALFASARTSQPNLADDNFTKVVLNSLPRNPFAQERVNLRKSFSFDMIGALLGLLCVYFFVDLASVASALLNVVPESLVISPVHVVGFAAAFMVTAIGAWWTVENVKL